ncbi:MAG: Gx transporter family protein [Ruminococcus sp.]|uniref:Gx transporter family protein n=1 Tax=Ruminococcus sp. TaxID=41978 RepID=UPI0025DE2C19|nr:Gx transporter family protein [Ruminococcus sp.]MCR5601824.1 Gx transporter family protein [Ruminococcus sp.]
MKTKKLTRLALLTALALIIFIIELQFPDIVPIPGVKLGLANIITVYAVYKYTAKDVFLIVTTRVVLGAIFGGNISALPYSLTGALTCLAGMLLIKRAIPVNFIWLSSIFGAILHNTGQIAAAVLMTGTLTVLSFYPFLIAAGCIAGAFTGICAQLLIKRNITDDKT